MVSEALSSDASPAENGFAKSNGISRSYGAADGEIADTRSSPQHEEEGLPVENGRAAWGFLIGCFWIEAITWGLPYSYSVFESYYSKDAVFSSEKGIAAVGTTCMGVVYFIGPAVLVVLRRWPSRRRHVSVLGLLIMIIGLFIASFATHVSHLIFSQGLLYGLGGSLFYNPFLFYVDEWFVKRKGLAYGIFWSGTGVSGAVTPFILGWALNTYGFRNTLRVWSLVLLVSLSCLVYLVKPPRSYKDHTVTLDINFEFLKTPLFWAFQFGNIIEGMGYFIPQVYLTSFAEPICVSELAAIGSVSILNFFSTIGLIFTGTLVDRYHISTVLILSAITSTLSVFLIWGFALSTPILYLFSAFFGIFAGGYVSTWTGCAIEVQKITPDSDVPAMVGFLAAGRGVGCVAAGPLSEAILGMGTFKAKGAYGTRYGGLIIFTGLTMLMGRFGLFGKWGLAADSPDKGKQNAADNGEREPLVRS